MKLSDIGKTGNYSIISNYAMYNYPPAERKFLDTLVKKDYHSMTERGLKIRSDLYIKRKVDSKSLHHYDYRYWMNACETVLFGDSGIDCSTIDSETRFLYWRNYPTLSFKQRMEMEDYNIRVDNEKAGNLQGYYKSSIDDMFELFFDLYYREKEYYKSLDRAPKLVSVEDFKENYKHIEVLNMKWWSEDIEDDPSINLH